MSPKYSVGVAVSAQAKYHLPTADRSGAEPFTFSNSSMPILTSFLPGFSAKGKSTRVWKLVVRLCLTVRVKGTFCCEGLKALNWRLTNCFQFLTRAWRSPKLSPLAKTTFSALPPSSLHSSMVMVVAPSLPVSLGIWPWPTLSRASWRAAASLAAQAVTSRNPATTRAIFRAIIF